MRDSATKFGGTDFHARIGRDGFAVLPRVFSNKEIEQILLDLERVLRSQSNEQGSIRSSRELVYAARNLLSIWPRILDLVCTAPLRQSICEVLGPACGLVRALFFDKPPGRSWSLPWHKDLTIAVRDNHHASKHFLKPTTKAGVPHVEAPLSVLEHMLTARIHLDDVTDENGPLLVVPASHWSGKDLHSRSPSAEGLPMIHPILVSAGDVLLMRPLLAHSSGNSREGTPMHRRIIHLEFAGTAELPDSFEWNEFYSIDPTVS